MFRRQSFVQVNRDARLDVFFLPWVPGMEAAAHMQRLILCGLRRRRKGQYGRRGSAQEKCKKSMDGGCGATPSDYSDI